MTAQEYQQAGLALSLQVQQSEIDRAEEKVTSAYIRPIVGEYDSTDEAQKAAVMELAYLFLLQTANAKMTRAGAKQVNITSGNNVSQYEVLQQQAHSCAIALRELERMNAKRNTRFDDICRIFFKTNFFYNN